MCVKRKDGEIELVKLIRVLTCYYSSLPFLLISFVNSIFSLAPLVKKVSEIRVVEMTNKLCNKLLNGKDQHRDVASIALKTVVAEVSVPSLAQSILISLSPQLIKGITTPVSV